MIVGSALERISRPNVLRPNVFAPKCPRAQMSRAQMSAPKCRVSQKAPNKGPTSNHCSKQAIIFAACQYKVNEQKL